MRFTRKAAVAVVTAAATIGAAGGVVAATRSSDEAALQPTRRPADQAIEKKVDALVADMSLQEKLAQLQLLSDGQVTDDDARAGVGAVFSLVDPAKIRHLQEIAVNESPHHIPMLFAYDTIHGFRTIFPEPLGAASAFDPRVVRDDARVGARESAAVGLKQIYSPMVDVSHEPRWGRISEGAGEDPYLGSVMAAARVKGAQGADYSARNKVVTSPKHFAAYGQPEGGRDYNTTDMSEQRLRNLYLPPFKAAIDAGADTAMCSFNAINGVPGCGNRHLETRILKREWGFDGFVESDYTAVAEMRACPGRPEGDGFPCGHGVVADAPAAAARALNSGTDSEMVSNFIRTYGADLVSNRRVNMARIDDAVRRILRVKFRAGLFDHPYSQFKPANVPGQMVKPDAVAAARKAAGRSIVLLKNDDGLLPLDPSKKTAVIGPLGDSAHDMVGPWWGRGDESVDAGQVVTPFAGIKDQSPNATFTQGCTLSHDEPPQYDPSQDCDTDDFSAAVAAANDADQVVLTLGETREMSGEAASRSEIDLPGNQEGLIRAIKATGKPFVVVLFNGRPLALENVVDDTPALVEAWFGGVQAGNGLADVLFGKVDPGGKLPVSFPQRVGQVPIYYNHEPTGRPCDTNSKYNSRYRDLRTCDPLFAFGYGLSYTTFDVSGPRLSAGSVGRDGSLTASVSVKNTGNRTGDDVVQLYIHDPVARISQPVRRLRGFQRVTLDPGQKRTITFTLDRSDFGFYDNRGRFVVERGEIEVYAGDSSTTDQKASFVVN
jgi:beta-glucosidase